LRFLLKEVGCKLTLDIGHANTFGDLKAFITTLAEYTASIHLMITRVSEIHTSLLGMGKYPSQQSWQT
jgi:sugar phosphate isomerase/epimerase